MPANLTPEYERAERAYREARSDADRLSALLLMLSAIPKHKGTEKMQADLKRRISQLRKAQPKGAHSKGPDPFHVPKGGAGQVVLVGPPNTGKSSLLVTTTNADVKVADYPFTTLVPHPGMWSREDVQIELVDTPSLTAGHLPPGLLGTIRSADVICVVVDASGEALEQIEMATGLLAEKGISLRSRPRNLLEASVAGQRSSLVLANKVDAAAPGSVEALKELYDGQLEVLAVSARTRHGLDDWFKKLWELLAIIRVYAKRPGHPADLGQPFALPLGSTVEDLARRIHRELPARMKHARIWGNGRHEGQPVHRNEVLRDRDIVEIHQ